jgi:hypothetical protein
MKQRKYVLPELPSVNRVNALYGLRISCVFTRVVRSQSTLQRQL